MEVAHDGTTSLSSGGRALQAKLPLVGTQSHAPQPLPGQALFGFGSEFSSVSLFSSSLLFA